jgi:hypothetical protein
LDAVDSSKTLTDAERIDRLRLIRSDDVGPLDIVAQTPPGPRHEPGRFFLTSTFKG